MTMVAYMWSYIPVMVEQLIGQVMEHLWIIGREEAVMDLVYSSLELSI